LQYIDTCTLETCRKAHEEAPVQEHVAAEGSSLTGEQRIQTQLEHAAHLLAKDLPSMGEMLLQLGGERGIVTGPLEAEELQRAFEAIEASAREVCRCFCTADHVTLRMCSRWCADSVVS
jgi:hypothetical protein